MTERHVITRRTFTLRSAEEVARLAELERSAAAQVLLIEDDAEMRAMLARELRRDGHHVIEAGSGAVALEILGDLVFGSAAERRPTIVLSDVRLPHFSGIEILEAVQLTTRRIPVILMTAFGSERLHQLARGLGATQVLDKPFEMDALRDAVRAATPA